MLGVSLPFGWLLTGEGPLGDRECLLDELKQNNVRSIELRTVKPESSALDVKAVAEMLWDKGFMITVHGTVSSVETAVELANNGDDGIPVPDYVVENVSTKVVKIIQSYTRIVDKMVWRKF
jgi:hypothetical protein